METHVESGIMIEEKINGDTHGYKLIRPRVLLEDATLISLNNEVPLDGDEDEEYMLKFNFTYTMSSQRYFRLLINDTITTNMTTVNTWYGYWLGNVTPISDYQSYLTMIRPHGNGRVQGKAILTAPTGDGPRTLHSTYQVRDTTNGFLACESKGWWDDTTTNITSLALELYNGNNFDGWFELYKKIKTYSRI